MFSTPFDIRPSLTDDRRPPPDAGPPSPALRRYLNPNRSAPPDSPAQLHFWMEHRSSSPTHNAPRPKLPRRQKSPSDEPDTSKRAVAAATTSTNQIADTSHLPRVVPLATCIPSAVRTAHASSPPIWLAPDGTPANKLTATPLLFDPYATPVSGGPLRQREPRENSDFLRMWACEVRMKKAGKLKISAGHASMSLPRVGEDRRKVRETGEKRWAVWVRDEALGGRVVRVV
jgi:hypothetical protein